MQLRFADLLARADSVLDTLMPEGTAPLVKAIDAKLAYPSQLIKILLNLRPPAFLLDDKATRKELLMLLAPVEANSLAAEVGAANVRDPYVFLESHSFSKQADRRTLFNFFGVEIPQAQTPELIPAHITVSPSFGMFPHQEAALRRVEQNLSVPPHRTLLHMPTGSGKTRTAMNAVSNYLRARERGVVVWLAHSEELCEQAAEEFQKSWSAIGSRPIPLIRNWGPYEADLRDVLDGVIILGLKKAYAQLSTNDVQIRALRTRDPFVVMDEAHQAIAPTYKMIIEQLLAPLSQARLLGLSATPGRTWNDPAADRELAEFFASRKVTLSVPGYASPVDYLISSGYLAAPKFVRIESANQVFLSLQEQKRVQETFELPTAVLERLAASQQRNLLIIHHAEQLLKRHRRVILFAASVQQSDLLAAVLTARGHWAASVTSKSAVGRAEAIASFKDEEQAPKILCNFGVLTTGFDAPRTSAALIARPTLSLVLYSQMVGRAMRGLAAGGNAECEILTVVDPSLPGFGSVVSAFANWEDVWRD